MKVKEAKARHGKGDGVGKIGSPRKESWVTNYVFLHLLLLLCIVRHFG
jgi:hypothetical protein